jgi:hypothetical protein
MLVCTIATADNTWLGVHLPRWLRKLRQHNPTSETGLFLIGDASALQNPTVQAFTKVKLYPPEQATRPFFNSVRMEACNEFNVPEALYIDCDCDVMQPLDGIGELSDKACLWVRSCVVNQPVAKLCAGLGFGQIDFCANNGLLYMRRNLRAEYGIAYNRCCAEARTSRIGGLLAFNVMLRMFPDLTEEIPYEWSTVWHDTEHFLDDKGFVPKTVQFCNNDGQAFRQELENKWRSVH